MAIVRPNAPKTSWIILKSTMTSISKYYMPLYEWKANFRGRYIFLLVILASWCCHLKLTALLKGNNHSPEETYGLRGLRMANDAANHRMKGRFGVQHINSFFSSSKTADDQESSWSRKLLSDVNIAFMGDSITRYQYLSLVHYAHTGSWPEERVNHDISNEKTFHSWNDFYNYSTSLFDTKLKCDCFHPENTFYEQIVENRYYRDTTKNLYLTFIQKFGDIHAKGYLNARDVYNATIPPYTNYTNQALAWEYNWVETIRDHIAKLHPKPDYLVLNAGLWANHFHNFSELQTIRQALDDANIVGIFRTTTRGSKYFNASLSGSDQLACQVFQYCLDITAYTASLHQTYYERNYWDANHFAAHVNKKLNEMFLHFLTNLETKQEMAQLPVAGTMSKQ